MQGDSGCDSVLRFGAPSLHSGRVFFTCIYFFFQILATMLTALRPMNIVLKENVYVCLDFPQSVGKEMAVQVMLIFNHVFEQ